MVIKLVNILKSAAVPDFIINIAFPTQTLMSTKAKELN
jgi:hypothetical protein